MTSKKRGPQASYLKIIYDQKVIAVYKKSEETHYLKQLADLIGCYRTVATAEEYGIFLDAQKRLLRHCQRSPEMPVFPTLLP